MVVGAARRAVLVVGQGVVWMGDVARVAGTWGSGAPQRESLGRTMLGPTLGQTPAAGEGGTARPHARVRRGELEQQPKVGLSTLSSPS